MKCEQTKTLVAAVSPDGTVNLVDVKYTPPTIFFIVVVVVVVTAACGVCIIVAAAAVPPRFTYYF